MAKNSNGQQKVEHPRTSKLMNLEHTENQDNPVTGVKLSYWSSSAVVFLVAVLCFINSYDGDFVFDDSEAIENNKDLLPSTPLWNLMQNDFWGRKLGNLSHKSYRPLTVLTFRWNYWAAGGLYPLGFHVINILLHGMVCAALLPVFSIIISADGTCRFQRLALVCSLLFAVHPVHTESVAGVVGRADLLCALFFILSFLAYVKGVTVYSRYRPECFSSSWVFLSTMLSVLATFSKEQGITVIGICCAYDILVVCGFDLRTILSLGMLTNFSEEEDDKIVTRKASREKHDWKLAFVKRQLILFIFAALQLFVRWRVMGSTPPIFQIHDNPHSFVNGTVYRALNYNYLYAINAWILLCPQWLCFDWSMGCVPTVESLADLRLLSVVTLWLVLLVLAWQCLNEENEKTKRSLILSIALIVIPFLPATNIFFRVGFVIAERVLYIPSAGFCLLIGLGLHKLSARDTLKNIVYAGFVLLVCVFFIRSMQRSNQWRKGWWLFTSGEQICPFNAKVHYNIAKLSADAGNITLAEERYKLAIELNPVYDQAMNNLANIYKDQNKLQESEELLDKAVAIAPDFAAAWMNRGITKAALKKYEESERSYKQAIRCRKNYPDCYYNLGNLYLEMGRNQEALDAWKNATQLKPTHWNSWNNAIILLDNLNYQEQAANVALSALRFIPHNSAIQFSLANVFGKQDNYKESEKYFLLALQGDPRNPTIHMNLGVLYHRWGKYKEALACYTKSLELDPHNQVTMDNLNLLKAKMKMSA
uniref:dolichyl-phosphate-mannose--protein mannosyltransferase n=1 Tax=Biomphalaria glabrata TaxID=6526 RepID=A0A2C9JZX4_BIOGL